GTVKESADTEINSLLDIQIQQEDPHIQSPSLLNVHVSVILEQAILSMADPLPPSFVNIKPVLQQQSIPIPTPLITTAAPAATIVPGPLLAIIQRVSEPEKDVKTLKQVNYSPAILAIIRSQAPTAVDEYLGSSLGDALQKKEQAEKQQMLEYLVKSSDKDALDEYDQKNALFQTMTESKSFNKHPTHKALYHALMESLLTDEEGMDQGVAHSLRKKRQHDDQEKTLQLDQTRNKGKEVDDSQEQTWFNNLQSAEKAPLIFNELMATPIDFSNFAMNRLKIDKLTKAHLIGLVYEFLKGTCESSIELELNMEECYKALTNQLKWENLKGHRCPFDLSKPLPLKGRAGHLTVATEYFFNSDLEFLKSTNPERKYTTLITKIKAALYELMGIEDMIPKLWSATKLGDNQDAAFGISHWGPKHQLFY
ncbi:hypothetical protein Tco_1510209, partial [Tanacetum coccineum]